MRQEIREIRNKNEDSRGLKITFSFTRRSWEPEVVYE